MFCAAVHTLVKAVGEDTLIGVDNLAVANDTKILQIVLKKYRRWAWQSPKYYVTEFTLNQVLEENDPLEISSVKSNLLQYVQEREFDIKGTIGAKMCSEISSVNLCIEDSITLSAKCGSINREQIGIPDLMESLKSKHLDFHHPLVKQTREDKRRVLCVITEVVYLENEGLLHSKMENKKSGSFTAHVPAVNMLNVEASGDYDDERDKAFKIPAGTPLAYAVCELVISKTGRIELVVVDGARGRFGAFDDVDDEFVDIPDSKQGVTHIKRNSDMPVADMFNGFVAMTSHDRDRLRHVLHHVMANGRLVKPLLKQLKKAYKAIDGTVAKTTTIDILRNDISNNSSDWKPFLSYADFSFSDSGEVTYYGARSDMLESCMCFLEAVYELDDDVTKILRKLHFVNGTAFVALLRHAVFSTKTMNIDRPGLSPLLEITSSLEELKFTVEGNIVTPPKKDSTIQAAYRVAFALWGC